MKNHTRHKNDFDLYGDIARLKEVLADTTQDIRGKASDMLYGSLDDAKEKTTEIHDQVKRYIVKKPMKAIGFAVIAGFVAGLWFRG